MINRFKRRFDWSLKPITLFPLAVFILTFPVVKMLPVDFFYENHFIENSQLFILFFTFLICLNAKIDKKFYNSMALLCLILFLREISCGNILFFSPQEQEGVLASFNEIMHSYLAYSLYGVFIAVSSLYFIVTKSYIILYQYIIKAKISVYNWIFLILGMTFGFICVDANAPVLENMAEILCYLAFMAIIYLQSQDDNYIETVKDE